MPPPAMSNRVKLLDDVKARSQGKAAFNELKQLDFPLEVLLMIPTALNEKSTDINYTIFWNNVN